MATRMQQRRGTAAQWTSADPILAAGEIGFESDSGQFKIGDGVNHWADLSYFKNLEDLGGNLDDYLLVTTRGAANGVASLDAQGQVPASQLSNVLASAPQALDTLNELAAALGNDANFSTTILAAIGTKVSSATFASHADATTGVHGIANTALLATKTYADDKASESRTAAQDTAATDAASKVSTHNSATTSVHGIADTANLATKSYADGAVTTAVAALTKSSVGLSNVDNTSDANKPVSTATQTALGLKANLAGPTFTGTVNGITKSMVGLGSVDNTADTAKPVSTAQQTALDAKLNSATAATTYAPIASPTFTGTVAGVTKAHVGLGNVDNTADTAKPVSTAQATAIATAKSEAIASATSQVTAVINGAPAAFDTLKEIADYIATDQTAASAVTASLALKAPLASPTFTGTVSGITKSMVGLASVDNTADTAKPVSTAQQTALDAKLASATAATTYAPIASPTFTGTVTLPAAGIVFSDGTQAKEGVPSRTPIIQKTAGYTLSALTERDSLIEVSSASGVTISIPTDATLNYPVGTSIDILQTNTGQVTIAAVTPGTTTVNGTPGLKLRTQWSSATLFKRAANVWVVMGDLTA